jgi:4-hydroxybenzoate polyprenyltransferase
MKFSCTDNILVVDLDGTLLRTDMLFETFWSSFSSDWRTPLIAVMSLAKGRAALKMELAKSCKIDVSLLPYNKEVISYIERWRSAGGRTALVTASDQGIADQIAQHLGLFDEIYGSDGKINLKGQAKAEFLSNRFSQCGFAYMGDTTADLLIWEKASKAITVNAPQSLKARVENLIDNVEHLSLHVISAKPYLKAIRPHQWLKNMLIFLPFLAAHQFSTPILIASILAFISFSLVASSVYVLNDLLDLAVDRSHPRKCDRPFASGSIPIAHGSWMVLLLILAGFFTAISLSFEFVLVMVCYYIITTAYSIKLKRLIIMDICTLALLYTARIIAGATATSTSLSVWLMAFSIFFFFSLATVKRQAELVDGVARGMLSLHGRGYHISDLPLITNIAISSGYISVLVMALYLNSSNVLELYSHPNVLWGICLVLLYWISMMVMATHRNQMHDDPIIYAVKDRNSHICLGLIVLSALGGTFL